jgi:hypothetical protein
MAVGNYSLGDNIVAVVFQNPEGVDKRLQTG